MRRDARRFVVLDSLTFFFFACCCALVVTCLYLNRTGLQSTDTLLGSLSRWVIEAQTLPLLAAVAFLVIQSESGFELPADTLLLGPS